MAIYEMAMLPYVFHRSYLFTIGNLEFLYFVTCSLYCRFLAFKNPVCICFPLFFFQIYIHYLLNKIKITFQLSKF